MQKKDLLKFKIPNSSGVYFFLKGKEILYIGKATSLKDRIKSYFGKDLINTRGPILIEMVFQANNIKWQKTDSVLEALILEANLIKKYQPKYNTKEKSDKSFNYVCITKEKIPKVVILRGKNLFLKKQKYTQRNIRYDQINFAIPRQSANDGEYISDFFGPFTKNTQLKEALKLIRRIFPFLDDKSKNYLEFYKQINLIPDLNDTEIYLQNIKNIKLFFQGKKKKILQNLKKEMFIYSKNREFEKALELKRQIFALQHINDVALIKDTNDAPMNFLLLRPSLGALRGTKWDPRGQKIHRGIVRIEAYDIAHMAGKNMVGVMVVLKNNELEKKEYKKFKIRTQKNANDIGALAEVLERRLKHREWPYPDLIVLDGGVAQINIAKKIMSRFDLDIEIVAVVKNEKHKPKTILLSPRSDLKGVQGPTFLKKYKSQILLANSEAHRFAIAYHKKMRNKNFLK